MSGPQVFFIVELLGVEFEFVGFDAIQELVQFMEGNATSISSHRMPRTTGESEAPPSPPSQPLRSTG